MSEPREGAVYGWDDVDRERKREIIAAIIGGRATRGPAHAELDLTDRCNVACYFCNQQDVRTKDLVEIGRVREMIDELAATGLRSVRLSGGGDPLYHGEIGAILDHLAARGILIDNITTNGVLLGPEIAARLVRDSAREVVFSLNAADPDDYHRMMKVKGTLFDRVVENIRHLASIRTATRRPRIVCQFLLDRENFDRVETMVETGLGSGADRIVVNPVMDIPRERIDRERLLTFDDRDRLAPHLRRLFERDREAHRLEVNFPTAEWNAFVSAIRQETGHATAPALATAPSFKEENGHCFFGWYTMTIRGNGDLYPCCLLMTPDYEPLGNARNGSLAAHWKGAAFSRLRTEMREVLLRKGKVFYRPERFRAIRKQCIEPHQCWLKNMYFRADEEFYSELGKALDEARRREVRSVGSPRAMLRAIEAAAWDSERVHGAYERLRSKSRPLRLWLKRRLHLNVAGAAVRET